MDELRNKPENADDYCWDQFNQWADENGVETHPDDWIVWYETWVAAIKAYKTVHNC